MFYRIFDVFTAAFGLWFFGPVMAAAALWVKLDSKGPIFFRQERIGLKGKPFWIFKFRTMVIDADRKGTRITVGKRDPRITNAGYWLRKFKLDEFPQLINVFFGEMSFVGPRPEIPYYVKSYDQEQRKILDFKPGITDLASIAFRNENEILGRQTDPERYYQSVIMPRKIRLNLKYLSHRNFCTDIIVILKTLRRLGK